MSLVPPTSFEFNPPEPAPTPLQTRLTRIATTGEITRSIATAHLPYKKASQAAHASISTPGRTVKDTKSLCIGVVQVATSENLQPKTPIRTRRKTVKVDKIIGEELQQDSIVKRVFEPEYDWPNPYAKDREARAMPQEPLTTVLFGPGYIPKPKVKKHKPALEPEKPLLAIEPAPSNRPELPVYSVKKATSLSDIRLKERIKAKIAPKVNAWKQEIASILNSKKSQIEQERLKLKA